jgi:aminoglycoside phosphotransferase
MSGTVYSLRREGEVLRSLASSGLPVPRVLGVMQEPMGLVLEFVEGATTLPPEDPHFSGVVRKYMSAIAELHLLAANEVWFEAVPDTCERAVSEEMDRWQAIAAAAGLSGDVLISLGLNSLRQEWLPSAEPARIVHGDAGPGNFLYAGEELTAMLDWELSHVGDPIEDLGWIWVRALNVPFGSFDDRVREYQRAIGEAVEPRRVGQAVAFALLRNVIAIRRALTLGVAPEREFAYHVVLHAYEALLGERLCNRLGVPIEIGEPSRGGHPLVATMCDFLEQELKREGQRGRAGMVRAIRAHDDYSAWVLETNASDCLATCGSEALPEDLPLDDGVARASIAGLLARTRRRLLYCWPQSRARFERGAATDSALYW